MVIKKLEKPLHKLKKSNDYENNQKDAKKEKDRSKRTKAYSTNRFKGRIEGLDSHNFEVEKCHFF